MKKFEEFICPKCGKTWTKNSQYKQSLTNQNLLYMFSTGKEIEDCCFSCGYVKEKISANMDEYSQMIEDEYMAHMDTRD